MKVTDNERRRRACSGGCFATESIRKQLGVEGVRTVLRLTTMHGESQVESNVMDNLIVTSLNDDNPIELPHTYTRDEIPADHRQIPTPNLISHWAHLCEVTKRIPGLNPHLEIGLLIGSNCPAALEPLEVVPCQGGGPFALRLRHGWTVSGPLRVEIDQDSKKIKASNYCEGSRSARGDHGSKDIAPNVRDGLQ